MQNAFQNNYLDNGHAHGLVSLGKKGSDTKFNPKGWFFVLNVDLLQGEQEPPTLYEYFASPNGENVTGLVAEIDGFK